MSARRTPPPWRPLRIGAFAGLLLLTACGFQLGQLGGAQPTADLAKRLCLVDRNGPQQLLHAPLMPQLAARLNIDPAAPCPTGAPRLVLEDEQESHRSLSLTADLFSRRIELEKRVRYQLFDAAGELLTAGVLNAQREILERPHRPAAQTAERNQAHADLNADLSRQLRHRLQAALEPPQSP